MSAVASVKDFISSFMLTELFKGMALTGKYMFKRKITIQFPEEKTPLSPELFNWVPGWIWLGLKTFVVVTLFLWVRATFPRFRYDQIMRLGWKIFIPVTLVWLVVIGAWMQTPYSLWK